MEDVITTERRYFNDRMYELLEFRAEHGHCRVPKNGGELGKFVKSLRSQYKKEQLPQGRMKVLNSIGFEWDAREYERTADSDSKWHERFAELAEFKRVNGHTSVPQNSGDLGRWVKMQREQKRTADLRKTGIMPLPGKRPRPCMPPDRIEKLDSIGFSWTGDARMGWEERYQQLLAYRQEHGDCHVPQHYPENRSLGRWVMKQRCQYNLKKQGKKSQLNDDKEAKLQAIGFAWVAPGYVPPSRKKRKVDDEDEEEDEEDAPPEQPDEHHYLNMNPYHSPLFADPQSHRKWFV